MREAKATTVAEARNRADMMEQMLKNGVRSVSGAKSTLDEAAKVTDTIVRIMDTSQWCDFAVNGKILMRENLRCSRAIEDKTKKLSEKGGFSRK